MGKFSNRLPTITEAQEFLRLVNVGREAVGLDRLAVLDFEHSCPRDPCNCLSARNLFVAADPDDGTVGSETVVTADAIAVALDLSRVTDPSGPSWRIPDAIKRVTDPFDAETEGLRERLVEAGVVEA